MTAKTRVASGASARSSWLRAPTEEVPATSTKWGLAAVAVVAEHKLAVEDHAAGVGLHRRGLDRPRRQFVVADPGTRGRGILPNLTTVWCCEQCDGRPGAGCGWRKSGSGCVRQASPRSGRCPSCSPSARDSRPSLARMNITMRPSCSLMHEGLEDVPSGLLAM